VMADVDRQLAIVQQRSPAINGCQGRFAADLSIWLRDAGFKEVQSLWLHNAWEQFKAVRFHYHYGE
jgi:hypothetical protein